MMSNSEWHNRSSPKKSPQHSPSPIWNEDHEPRLHPADKIPSLRNPETQDVFQSIVKGRKSWKTLRGGEVVWPPELEAALLEGLESYQPDDSRETRLLGRFPLRNRFISDFIFHKTGKRRTAKQVGSRLQQLRDTCGGKQLLSLLSPCRKPGVRPSNQLYRSSVDSDSSENSSPSSPISPAIGDLNLPGMWSPKSLSPSVICIDILPENISPSSPGRMRHPSTPSCIDDTVVSVSSEPRLLRRIDPTVTFIAQSSVSATSTFMVTVDGAMVHSEVTSLIPQNATHTGGHGSCLYSTPLVPNYWSTIVQSSDPTQYQIHQTVQRNDQSGSSTIYSAIYKFRYRTRASTRYTTYTSPPSPPSSQFLHSFTNTDDVNMVCEADYLRPEPCYPFEQYSGQWSSRSYTPRSDSTNNSTEYRTHDRSRSSSLSPTSACFPADLANYVL